MVFMNYGFKDKTTFFIFLSFTIGILYFKNLINSNFIDMMWMHTQVYVQNLVCIYMHLPNISASSRMWYKVNFEAE